MRGEKYKKLDNKRVADFCSCHTFVVVLFVSLIVGAPITPSSHHQHANCNLIESLYCTQFNFTTLHCTLLQNTALHCTVLQCITLQFTALHYSALNSPALSCTALQCTLPIFHNTRLPPCWQQGGSRGKACPPYWQQ